MTLSKNIIVFTLFYFAFLNITFSQKANTNFCNELLALNDTIQKRHFSPKKVDDNFSKEVFNLFVSSLDQKKEIFTQENIDSLKKHQKKIDDYIHLKKCSFFNDFSTLYNESLENRIQFLFNLKQNDFNFNNENRYVTLKNYNSDKASLNDYWRKKIQRKVIIQVVSSDTSLIKVKSNFKKNKTKLLKEIIDKELCLLNSLLKKSKNTSVLKDCFFNAILKYQDPNSAYFSESEKKSFVNSLSVNTLSFGFETYKKDGDIIISSIINGSVAFKNKDIEEGDVILLITSKKERLETNCISNKDINDFLNNKSNSSIILKLKKKNGEIKNVSLKKEILKTSSNKVKAFIINKNIGYINIESFYTSNTLGVANDVSKEIFKLKKENIDGLILDLRFNGGGSMKEASELSGMFIDRGPLAIIKERNQENFTVKDYNRGTLFDKPVVILINHFSASASEYFASLMQDYKRAIIVGNTSYGKASSQVILPLKNGFAKITVGKFYRVTGESIQAKGVIPNITLPSFNDKHKIKEKHQDFSLKTSSIPVILRHKNFTQNLISNEIIEKANRRIASNNSFIQLKQKSNYFLKNYVYKPKNYSLKIDSLFIRYKKFKYFWDSYDKAIVNKHKIVVSNTTTTNDYLIFNEDEKETNDIILKNISSDLYISEAYNIIVDYINSNTSK